MGGELSRDKEEFLARVRETLPASLHERVKEKVAGLPDKVEIYLSISKTQDILAFIELFEAYCRGKKTEPHFELLNGYCLGLIMIGVGTLLAAVTEKPDEPSKT